MRRCFRRSRDSFPMPAATAGGARNSISAPSRMARCWRGSIAVRCPASACWRWACTSTGWYAGPTGCMCGLPAAPPTSCWIPSKLDHIVAGGVPAGLTPAETLVKEADEEAAIPAHWRARRCRSATITYAMERPEGLRRDLLHCYDLDLPEEFRPARRPMARWRRSNSGRSNAWCRPCATRTRSSSTSTWC